MGLELYDKENILDKINKSKRKKLMAFIREHDGEESKIIPAGSSADLPTKRKRDTGTLVIIMVGRNLYNPYRDYWTLIDTLDKDGKETFTKYYKRQSAIVEFLDIQAPAVKVGRKKRVFSDEEKRRIAELHAQGVGIGKIARELKTSNRLIMSLLK